MAFETCLYCLEDILDHNYVNNTGYCNCKVKYHPNCLTFLQNNNFKCIICPIHKINYTRRSGRNPSKNYIERIINNLFTDKFNDHIKKITIITTILCFIISYSIYTDIYYYDYLTIIMYYIYGIVLLLQLNCLIYLLISCIPE